MEGAARDHAAVRTDQEAGIGPLAPRLLLVGVGITLLLAGLGLTLLWLAATDASAGGETAGCDRFASKDGHDGARGTAQRPVHSAHALVDRLRRGQTGCFRSGRYRFRALNIDKHGVTLTAYGSDKVALKGSIQFRPSGRGSAIKDLRINGAGGRQPAGVRIHANRVSLRSNVITNYHHSTSCVLIASYYSRKPPRSVHIMNNRIHDCGRLPRTNHDHGIYVQDARRTVIARNWIYDNADRGIQLYPAAQRSTIEGNVLDQNGEGINFSGANNRVSNHNLVRRNVITRSHVRWNAASGPTGPRAVGNVFKHNCVYGAAKRNYYNTHGGVETPSRNFRARHNKVAPPRFVDARHGDLNLRPDSGCRSL
jgi:hypothetical protein